MSDYPAASADPAPTPAAGASGSALPRVAFLGPEGTFASLAVRRLRLFPQLEPVPLASVPEVIDSVDHGLFDYGLVPFENSVEGIVTPTLDRLVFRSRHALAAEEVVVPVSFTAFVAPRHRHHPGPWALASHPHGLAQCRDFTEKHAARLIEAASTAKACELAADAEEPTLALASPNAGQEFGLEPLLERVEDHPGAATRFLLLARAVAPASQPSATLMVVTPLEDHAGSLAALLRVFEDRSLNLTALVVRPLRRALGLYTFIITVRSHIADPAMQAAAEELLAQGNAVKLLGSYWLAGPEVESPDSPAIPVGSMINGVDHGGLHPAVLDVDPAIVEAAYPACEAVGV